MATMKKAQNSAKVVAKKTTVKVTPKVTPKVKKTNNDVKMYNIKGKILSGEGNDAMDQNYNMLKKNGGKMKKAANGTSLGMKSVKARFDKNPGVTRADFVAIGKGTAKSGKTIKKSQNSSIMRPVGLNIGSAIQDMQQLRKEKMDLEKAKENNTTPRSTTPSKRPPDSNMSNPYPTSGVNLATLAKSGGKMKMGGKMAKQAAVAIAMKKAGKTPKKAQMGGKFGDMGKPTSSMPSIPTGNNAGSSQKTVKAKAGKSMKKCRYGCK